MDFGLSPHFHGRREVVGRVVGAKKSTGALAVWADSPTTVSVVGSYPGRSKHTRIFARYHSFQPDE